MPRVAILIAASPTRAFYSQVAALTRSVQSLEWSRWQPSMHLYVGGEQDADAYAQWLPHLRDVDISHVSEARFARDGDWAQSDDAFRFAPRDADVLVAMDADTFAVADLEGLLDRVLETDSIAGVIAHYPTLLSFDFDAQTSSLSVKADPRFPETSVRRAWTRIAEDFLDVPLEFAFSHTLMDSDSPPDQRLTPFYLNFGVVFFPRSTFDDVSRRYLEVRPKLMERLALPDFSGQVALTLAITAAGARTLALPMRFNFPNDPVAAALHPEELAQVAVFHYLRTANYERHQIFASAGHYADFLALPLTGVDQAFQQSVRRILGADYPFV
jgi:hypothetical protein